eukprot:1239721-Pyramimonas_sp.AAC.1
MQDNVDMATWQDAFEEHPLRNIAGDNGPVCPIALYCDGARYTRSTQVGKSDSLFNITCYDLLTGRRHSTTCVSKRELRKC